MSISRSSGQMPLRVLMSPSAPSGGKGPFRWAPDAEVGQRWDTIKKRQHRQSYQPGLSKRTTITEIHLAGL
jgi:hypothetical protein